MTDNSLPSMNAHNLPVLAIFVIALTAGPQKARAQTLDCSTIQGASEYGTDVSLCRMPDQSTLRCTEDKGGLSHCKVEHTNGFVSATDGADAGPVPMILTAIVRAIGEHRARKAGQHLLDAVDLQIKSFSLLSDWLTTMDLLTARVNTPPGQWLQLQQNLRQLQQESLAVLSGEKDLLTAPVLYPAQYKGLHQLHDKAILADCPMRDWIVKMTDPFRRNVLPDDILRAMNAIDSDLASLKGDCSSRDAIRLLAKDRNLSPANPH